MQITDSSRPPHSLDTFTRQAASTLITVYQKQLSPRKGFSCAYRVLHHSESCSQFTKRAILELGLGQALPLIRQRFQECKSANQRLKAQGCRSAGQQATVPVLPAIAPEGVRFIELAPHPWLAIDDGPLDDESLDPPDENSESGENQPVQRRTGGGSFRKPPAVGDAETTAGTSSNGNGSNWNCDSLECASFGCDAIDCSSADWSAMHCGTADCSGADCGSLDCGSCDVGSCDCSS